MKYSKKTPQDSSLRKFIKNVVRTPGRILDGIEKRDREYQDFKRNRNEKIINDTWGNIENYNKTKR